MSKATWTFILGIAGGLLGWATYDLIHQLWVDFMHYFGIGN
jgi:hypothetical protein